MTNGPVQNNPGQQPTYTQYNAPAQGGVVHSSQGGQQNITYHHTNNTNLVPDEPRVRRDTKILLVLLVFDVAFFFYGMNAYTAMADNVGDQVRAVAALVLFSVTIRMIVKWIARRLR